MLTISMTFNVIEHMYMYDIVKYIETYVCLSNLKGYIQLVRNGINQMIALFNETFGCRQNTAINTSCVILIIVFIIIAIIARQRNISLTIF